MKNVVVGRGRTVRIGPWRGQPGVASVATYLDEPIDADAVREITARLHHQGYHRAVTAALAPAEQEAFTATGFQPLQELVLMKRTLDSTIPRAQHRLRRHRRRKFDDVLAIDAAAFDSFWRFDVVGLREAIDATPHRSLRVTSHQPPVGYALSGVARERAYLQRLAVHPDAGGQGIGTSLLLDALRWMTFRGADVAYVNTQAGNDRARRLYERNGFTAEPEGLAILACDLS